MNLISRLVPKGHYNRDKRICRVSSRNDRASKMD